METINGENVTESVAWADLTGKPTTIGGFGITDAYTDSEVDTLLGAKLDSASYTAADVLAKLLTVDGSGTGLDADLLDGNEAAAFALSGHNHDATYQALDSTLTALAAYDTNGIICQTASDTFNGRTITGTSNQIDVSDGDGVSGNPTLALENPVYLGSSGKIGRDADNLIDFSVDNQITFRTNAADYTITPTIFSYLDDLDQALTSTSTPTFASGSLIQTNQNGNTTFDIRNDESGTVAQSKIRVIETTNAQGVFSQLAPGYSTSSLFEAGKLCIHNVGSQQEGINIFTTNSKDVKIGTGNSTRLTIDSSGYAKFASRFACNNNTPLGKQTHIVDADGTLADITTKFNSLLGYLENFGFIATS